MNELIQEQKLYHGNKKSYLIGFILSLILTSSSFLSVIYNFHPIPIISSFALIQAIIQLKLFLHLGKEEGTKWETIHFFLMLTILLIIVLGSLWVMNDLNTRMMDFM